MVPENFLSGFEDDRNFAYCNVQFVCLGIPGWQHFRCLVHKLFFLSENLKLGLGMDTRLHS